MRSSPDRCPTSSNASGPSASEADRRRASARRRQRSSDSPGRVRPGVGAGPRMWGSPSPPRPPPLQRQARRTALRCRAFRLDPRRRPAQRQDRPARSSTHLHAPVRRGADGARWSIWELHLRSVPARSYRAPARPLRAGHPDRPPVGRRPMRRPPRGLWGYSRPSALCRPALDRHGSCVGEPGHPARWTDRRPVGRRPVGRRPTGHRRRRHRVSDRPNPGLRFPNACGEARMCLGRFGMAGPAEVRP